ncbi:MAG TPA: J domain-containing protein [Acetobacteraceae bacterium]|nr:J domain-containing protein [Acetobacteraceae bacterium]
MPGCTALGEYRAPRSRRALREWFWFCLEHVRAYNATWDYYRGMSPGQIEAEIRADVSWQRPTWPLGRLGSGDWRHSAWVEDPLGALSAAAAARPPTDAAPAELRPHLATLELTWPLTLETLKMRYKELAKRHHPDANGGDRNAEERLKTINLAYATLRNRVGRSAPERNGPAAAPG